MGLFSNKDKYPEYNYDSIRDDLKPKDGKIHCVMLEFIGSATGYTPGIQYPYSRRTDEILSKMQDDGYEIVDVKLSSTSTVLGARFEFNYQTLILYR